MVSVGLYGWHPRHEGYLYWTVPRKAIVCRYVEESVLVGN